jgi:hypothetical protein
MAFNSTIYWFLYTTKMADIPWKCANKNNKIHKLHAPSSAMRSYSKLAGISKMLHYVVKRIWMTIRDSYMYVVPLRLGQRGRAIKPCWLGKAHL